VRVDARVDAYVPAPYVDSEALRIDVHRRLALAETEDELRELQAALEDRYGPLPEPVEHLFRIQEAKIKVALLGADYLVFQDGKATVGRLVLGSGELRELRDRAKTAVYVSAKQEVSRRGQERIGQAVELVDAILDARRAA
jgi:transcription-repair coupling factor (superfamily II helicase)